MPETFPEMAPGLQDLHPTHLANLSIRHLSSASIAYLDRCGADGYIQQLVMVEEDCDGDDPVRLVVPFSGNHYWLDRGGFSLIAYPTSTGWFVYCADILEGTDRDDIPEQLVDLLNALKAAGCSWVRFADDAPFSSALPIYHRDVELAPGGLLPHAWRKYPVSDWQEEVASGETRLGYDAWLAAQMEQEKIDADL